MFELGDYIVYGNNGVCKVEEIGTVDIGAGSENKEYYTLAPVYSAGSKVFTPVDNMKVIMRNIISKEEASKLMDAVDSIDTIIVDDNKRREEVYKKIIKMSDCYDLARIIKTIAMRKRERIAAGKNVTSGDEKYLKMAEERLFGELALPLQMNRDEIEERFMNRIGITI